MKLEDEIKQKKFDSEHHKLVLNLLYTFNWIETPMKALISEQKITLPQYNILRILKGSFPKPLSPQDIKAVMLHKKSDLTRMLDRLVSKNLIDRKICPSNRRKMDITIRQEGIELLNTLNPKIRAATDDRIADNLSEKEAKIANDLIDKLRG
jgi:DNA-binding MarR family transcriptional regulator